MSERSDEKHSKPRRGVTPDEAAAREKVDDAIDEASEESFPASDPPSSWAGPPSSTEDTPEEPDRDRGTAAKSHRPKE